jgi:hypothetical protein
MIFEKIKYKKGNAKIEYVNRGTAMSATLTTELDMDDLNPILARLQVFATYVNQICELKIPGDDINLIQVTGLEIVNETKIGLGKGVKFYFDKHLQKIPYECIEGQSPSTYFKCEFPHLKTPGSVIDKVGEFAEFTMDTVKSHMRVEKQPSLFPKNKEQGLENAQ